MDAYSRRGADMARVRAYPDDLHHRGATAAGTLPYGTTGPVWGYGDLSRAREESAGNPVTIRATDPCHQGVRTMPKCVACGAELAPPVRVPHTVYVKTLYRLAGQDYCRHHIIRAAVAASVIAEVKPGAGPAVATRGGAHPNEYDRFNQH